MKVKVAELEGEKLDMWVAKAGEVWKTAHEMFPAWTMDPTFKGVEIVDGECWLIPSNPFRQDPKHYSPSTDWAQAGPIIESERICVRGPGPMGGPSPEYEWTTYIDTGSYAGGGFTGNGRTPLIAAMRCFVASKFGEEVEE